MKIIFIKFTHVQKSRHGHKFIMLQNWIRLRACRVQHKSKRKSICILIDQDGVVESHNLRFLAYAEIIIRGMRPLMFIHFVIVEIPSHRYHENVIITFFSLFSSTGSQAIADSVACNQKPMLAPSHGSHRFILLHQGASGRLDN